MLRPGDATWSNPKVLSTLLLIFLCGSAVGAVFTRAYLHSRWAHQTTSAAAIDRVRHLGLGSLKATLNLTPAQERVVTKTLDDYGKFYQNIEDEREDTAKVGTQQILEVLTPEQQKRFNQLIGQPSH